MIVFLCSGCQGSIKKAAMKVAHDNGVDIVTGGSGNLAGSGEELEGSFAELLLRLGIGVRDRRLSFACGAFFRLLANYVYLRCHTYENCIPDFGYRRQGSNRHWPF
jgi:hypothetical protein